MRDRELIIEKVIDSADRSGGGTSDEFANLIRYCHEFDENEIFFGLFSLFYLQCKQENSTERQRLAGKLLLAMNPASSLDLDASVYAAAKLWDQGIAELPWYWCKSFGQMKVTQFLEDTLPSVIDDDLEHSINKMLFWCRNNSELGT